MYKLLIATQEYSEGHIIKDFALDAGFDVSEAEDGMAAVSLSKEMDFDIIVMDTQIPKLDGFSVCKEIRKTKDTPVIFISASRNESDKFLGFEVGADDFMIKPLSIRVLMARINAIIQSQNRTQTRSV